MLMKPMRDLLVDLHDRVALKNILGDGAEAPAANQNDENTDGEMQSGIAFGRKPILQKTDLLFESPDECCLHAGTQPLAVRTNRSVEKRSNAPRSDRHRYCAIVVIGNSI